MYVMYSRNNKRATRLVFEHKQFFQVSVAVNTLLIFFVTCHHCSMLAIFSESNKVTLEQLHLNEIHINFFHSADA